MLYLKVICLSDISHCISKIAQMILFTKTNVAHLATPSVLWHVLTNSSITHADDLHI